MYTKPLRGARLNLFHPLARGLVGCWLFNEGVGNKAYDLSGCGNHGTLENMAFPPTTASGWNPGRKGGALAFDGSSDYINCGNDSSLNITGAITIEAWVKKTGAGSGDYPSTFISKWYDGTNACYNLRMASDTVLDVWFRDQNNNGFEDIFTIDDTSANFVHIVTAFDGSDLRVYSNGRYIGILAIGDIANTNTAIFSIGKYIHTTKDGYFNGTIDGVKIYNRVLSAFEIQQLYMYPYAMFEPAEISGMLYPAITPFVGGNVAAAELLR